MTPLVHTSDSDPGITRKGAGRGFYYLDSCGEKVTAPDVLDRIAGLAIPPAYRQVWICPRENGHLQATGRDSRKRKQYRYHPLWQKRQKREKFERLPTVGEGLPRLRRAVRDELQKDGLRKRRVVAAAVRLIDRLGHRVGSERYLEENGTRGITTLGEDDVDVQSASGDLHISYVGKGGREIESNLNDPLVAGVADSCYELPGKRLFCFRGNDGNFHPIDSGDVNAFLSEVYDEEVTAKDLRTWRASVAAMDFLRRIKKPADRESEVRDAIRQAASEIQNRYMTCRKHYVHPLIETAYRRSGRNGFSRRRPRPSAELQKAERLLLQLFDRCS